MKKLITLMGALALLPCSAFAQEAAAEATTDTFPLEVWEMVVFCIVVVGVIGLGIWKSGDPTETEEEKKEKGAEDYFLAGRGLSWWLIGFSLLAANISTEQFVGQGGKAADWLGFAIAGFEWLAAIVLVIVAFTFLPMLLKRGVTTIPEFLEARFDGISRVTMAIVNLVILVGVPTAAVIFAGATVVSGYFSLPVWQGCIIIAVCATVYVYVGGLKACAWTDLIWGTALVLGGGVVAYLAICALGNMDMASAAGKEVLETASVASGATAEHMQSSGSAFMDGLSRMWTLNSGDATSAVNGVGGKLHMMRDISDPEMPWTVYLLGLWIPNFFYWGLNQYIMQRTLAAKSLEEGQLGVVFAAFLKLLIPFIVVIPGILAYNLYRDDLAAKADSNAKAVIEKVEKEAAAANLPYLYTVDASRLIRDDSDDEAAKWHDHNLEVGLAGGLTNEEIEALKNEPKFGDAFKDGVTPEAVVRVQDAAQAELAAIPNAEVAKRAAVADKIMAIDKIVTANERADDAKYLESASMSGYQYDFSFATLLKNLMPGTGLGWFVLAALFGAVVSSLASMLNSASTLFTMDIYNKTRQVMGKPASPTTLVTVGKIGVLVCAIIATVIAPFLDNPAFGGIFTFIQEFQGFLSPGVLAVFLFGFFVPRCPRVFGWLGIVLAVVIYAALKWAIMPDESYINRMAVSLIAVVLVGLILTIVNKLRNGERVVLEDKNVIEMKTSARAKVCGVLVIFATLLLYYIFW